MKRSNSRNGFCATALALSVVLLLPVPSAFAQSDAFPSGMVLIPGGDFQMGNSFDASEGYSDELPRHLVHVDSFFMDRYEVTNQQYASALNWAKTNGRIYVSGNVVYGATNNWFYCDTTASNSYSCITWNGSTFGVVAGKENHPMESVSWFGAAGYANWRSEMEGRGASYTFSGTDPNWNCNFLSGGYRLPTEAEWEYAARGGVAGTRFPWSDSNNIQHARANYYSSASYSYDTSPTRGYHPTFATGDVYTSPVGYFAPNGFGLYDMAGNVWEWCNDRYGSTYYSVNTYPNPPRGPVTGSYRVLRGGSWGTYYYLRCASRFSNPPDYRGGNNGFRLALDSAAVLQNSQLQVGDDQPAERVSLEHLWQWSDTAGRFVDPGNAGVTIDPNKPTYLLTHGWDGTLDGTPREGGTACQHPEFAMSSVGCSIHKARPEANVLAWDWKDGANPNGNCDFTEAISPDILNLMEVLSCRQPTGAQGTIRDAWRSGMLAPVEGTKLAAKLAPEIKRLRSLGYEGIGSQLHLVGKSHGGGVLGRLAQVLSDGGLPVDSITTLDAPRIGCCSGDPETQCAINPMQHVYPSSVKESGQVAVFYYASRFEGGLGGPSSRTHANLTNVALNDVYVSFPEDFPAHSWIAGPNDRVCPAQDGWYPLNAWDADSGVSPTLRFLPPSPSPAYSLLDVAGFPAGNWEERDPYTFVSLERGACCYSIGIFGDCAEIPQVDCEAYPGDYKGNGTTCADSDADLQPDLCETTPPPTGACCSRLIPTGPFWCDQRTREWCSGFGFYEFKDEGSQCDTDGDGIYDICDTLAVTAGAEPTLSTPNPAPGMSLLRLEPFQSAATWFGNLTQLVIGADPDDATNRVILMQEQGDGSFFKDIDWPGDASVVTFDYLFREPRGEENLTVYVDNQIVYYDNAETTLAREQLTSSGAIYVGNVAGRTARINFVLRTDQPEGGQFGGELLIDNIRVYGFLEHDVDLDGDRDLLDFAALQRCFGASPIPDECWAFDVDGVDGVGLEDHRAMAEILDDGKRGGPKAVAVP